MPVGAPSFHAFDMLPGWGQDDFQDLSPLLKALSFDPPDRGSLRAYFEARFTPQKIMDGPREEGVFTGYYTPELQGSRRFSEEFSVPIYGPPDDLLFVENLGRFRPNLTGEKFGAKFSEAAGLTPYDTRAEIEAGSLSSGRAQPLVWVRESVEAFFMHIQGSGRIVFEDGSSQVLSYAATNGHAYTSIGRALVERGELPLERSSLFDLKRWLRENPEQQADILHQNASYVFFREESGAYPVSAHGVALVPGRSLAVDPAHIPLGSLLWIDVAHPLDPSRRIQRVVAALDVGSAIKGAIRGDYYWGSGETPETSAGHMVSKGGYFILKPKEK